MVVTPLTALGTASAVLSLSKAAWKLGVSLSRLDQDARIVDTTVKNLAEEVKSLGNECDHVYAELEEVISKSETGSPPPYDVDGRLWSCLATQVEESSRTTQELELFVRNVREEESSFIGQAQRQWKLDKSKDQIASIRMKVLRHTDNLSTTLRVLARDAPGRADRGLAQELNILQDMIEKLQRSSEPNQQSRASRTEATLLQCARELVAKGTTTYEGSLAAESVAGGPGAANSNIRVAEWEREVADAVGNDSEDDLDTDLTKAALETGTKAFEAREWEEADSLLQEALRMLQQLPKQQRAFCDIFDLQYKLAVCAYHTQKPADAEEALMSLVQQSARSDEQRGYIYDAAHLLSLLYIRMGQIDRARSECEKALQARRRLLGKRSDASLESTALMAHIYVLLNNRARAKSCLAMIPEERKSDVLRNVEESLGTNLDRLDSSPIIPQSIAEYSDLAMNGIQNRLSASSIAQPTGARPYGPGSTMISQSPVASLRQIHQCIPSNSAGLEDLQSVTVTSLLSPRERRESRAMEKEIANEDYSANPGIAGAAALSPGEPPEGSEMFKGNNLSRKEILDRIGCQPKDRIEDAVCDGDHSAFASLLNRKKDFWRSKLRKHVRPERVTALHFAALFGEIDMARRLIGSSFNINEAPYGYSTSLAPLKFAIGARQVEMVAFLIANGAKPSEPETWSTLAGQLMNRSWLKKTLSEAEKEFVPTRITAILNILLQHGWDVNAPYETSGGTVLHQAVTFWTGSYWWDLNLRATVTRFLCERGADPFRANKAGKTPYDMASASDYQDLLLVLDQSSIKKEPDGGPSGPFELSSEPTSTYH